MNPVRPTGRREGAGAVSIACSKERRHRPFTLLLAGGGARGLAHVGVLRALEHAGFRPSALVGVSMGAIVGATYGLNPDWYQALITMDTNGFPQPYAVRKTTLLERIRTALAIERTVQDMVLGWGVGRRSLPAGRRLLEHLTLGRHLEDAHPPVAAVATDLVTGERVVLRSGSAAEAIYASGALAGILPPHVAGDYLLADGAYADIAPVDIARDFGVEVVIAVNLDQTKEAPPPIGNGLQALMRALEICHYQHAALRFAEADLVLRPHFPFVIDTLDFSHKRLCIAAGARAVRALLPELRNLLGDGVARRAAPSAEAARTDRSQRPSDPEPT